MTAQTTVTTAQLAAAGAPIALWAVPRSRSTALLRVMLERGDLEVIHEPFSYLAQDGFFELAGQRLSSQPELLSALLLERRSADRRVFFKDTSDYRYPDLLGDPRLYRNVINTFVIREPAATISSHYALHPTVTLDEIGFEYLHTMFEAVRAATGQIPLVLDSDDLVADPEAYVRAYCEQTGLEYVDSALSWKPGNVSAWQRTERWHQDVANSAGITAKRSEHRDTPENNAHLRGFLEHHRPFYDALHAHRLKVAS